MYLLFAAFIIRIGDEIHKILLILIEKLKTLILIEKKKKKKKRKHAEKYLSAGATKVWFTRPNMVLRKPIPFND